MGTLLSEVSIAQGPLDSFLDRLEMGSKKRCLSVLTLNPEIFVLGFRPELYNYITADGIGIVLAFRLFLKQAVNRMTGIDLSFALFERIEKVYLLGSTVDVLNVAKVSLESRYSQLTVCCQDGFFDSSDFNAIGAAVAQFDPDLVLVGMGHPLQEQVIFHLKPMLNRGVVIGVGGVIDVLGGQKKWAPEWVRWVGLEWLFSLIVQPRRFFRLCRWVFPFFRRCLMNS